MQRTAGVPEAGKKSGKQYYYFAADYAMAKNKIVGSKSKGYYYVDKPLPELRQMK